ncbi:MAG: hypothetical protein KC609_14675 [Myxococcales bacterium]|nr:hypothetical protein [Myxococcales bacterium]
MVGRFIKENPLFSIALAILSVYALLPVWSVHYLPLLDWPQHLAMVTFLRHGGDPQWGFDQWVMVDHKVATYLSFYYLSAWFAYLMSVTAACKLVLSLYLIGTPLAAVYLLRSFERGPWPALLTFVVVFNWPLYMGFVTFVLSFPLILLGVGLIQRMSNFMTRPRFYSLMVVCVLLFLTHALSYLILGAIALPLVLVSMARRPRKLLLACAAWVPSLVLFGVWAFALFTAKPTNHLMNYLNPAEAPKSAMRVTYRPTKVKIAAIQENFNEGFSGNEDKGIYETWRHWLLVLIAVGVALVIVRHFLPRPPRPPSTIPWFRPLLVVALIGGLYFALPLEMLGVWPLSPRVVSIAALLAILAIGPLFRSRVLNALLFVPVFALALQTAKLNRTKFEAFQKETVGLAEILEKLPRGRRAYGLIYYMGSREMTLPVFMHFANYYVVERGGMVGFSQFHYNIMPAHYRNIALAPYPGQSGEWRPRRWKYPIYGPFYDILIVRGYGVPGITGAPRGALQLVARRGLWAAYLNPSAGKRRPLYSFREQIHQAKVTLADHGTLKSCGPFEKGRFLCPHQGWSWVGPYETRVGGVHVPCIWAHPVTGKVVRIRFVGVPRGTSIAGIYGIADSGFPGRRPFGAPVELDLFADGKKLSTLTSRTRPGYDSFDVRLPAGTSKTMDVEFRIHTKRDARRHFCFTATLFQNRAR